MEDREVMAMAETRRCEWCREIAQGACGCAAEVEIERLREALRQVKLTATSLSDAQVIALEALTPNV